MNAHMRNGTSLRAIHNKIRVVPGQASTRYPHWSLSWLTDLGMRLALGLGLELRLGLGLGLYLHWKEAAGAAWWTQVVKLPWKIGLFYTLLYTR